MQSSSEYSDPIPVRTLANLVQQHLVTGSPSKSSPPSQSRSSGSPVGSPVAEEIPVPYHLPGVAITHDVYTHANSLIMAHSLQRSKSTSDLKVKAGKVLHDSDNEDEIAFENLDKPGGFRRFHVQQQQQQQQTERDTNEPSAFSELFRPNSVASSDSFTNTDYSAILRTDSLAPTATVGSWTKPKATRHFLEYLAYTSVLDRFAGENLSDSEEEDTGETRDEEQQVEGEGAPLLRHRRPYRRKPSEDIATERAKHKTGTIKTMLLLFKAFIGSGILFLPKAFSNGGLGFSIVVIWLMGFISLYCFLLLLDCKNYIAGSYGDIGGALYGTWMRYMVLFSVAISQLGFVCGGTIFIAENMGEAIYALSHGTLEVSTTTLLIIIALLLMPLVLIRNIAKLSPTALFSDVLIVAGLVTLLLFDIVHILFQAPEGSHPPTTGPNIIWWINPVQYPVFVGTAVYAFEGIGLIIPIRDSMEEPAKFPWVLTVVMAMVATSLCLVGSLGYVAFGSDVKTVALLNLPPGALTLSVQIGYAVAIHLSNALVLFPTIRIVEQAIFGDRTGKHNIKVKWQKNVLRFIIVVIVGLIAWGGASDLDKFVSLIGSVCCCPLSLIFPAMFHLRLPKTMGFQRLVDTGLIIFGVGVMLFTLWNTSKQWAASG
ncbi:neutral amino acid transporter [Apophysomyces ossiformis]|uniref:Neutral amino acid transporter n=1 Tax=Apophysomyces ossiformis TaxID=679940 RepID=A0A8H7ES01_9FUNG|nr:neutral amino acid transporter [Apophysomyces ossiformis]